jgi:hypothetical protein
MGPHIRRGVYSMIQNRAVRVDFRRIMKYVSPKISHRVRYYNSDMASYVNLESSGAASQKKVTGVLYYAPFPFIPYPAV